MRKNFDIIVTHDYHRYKFHIDLLRITKTEEIYKLTAKNKTLIFTNNRPRLKILGLKHWKLSWTVEGAIWNEYFKELIIREIEKNI